MNKIKFKEELKEKDRQIFLWKHRHKLLEEYIEENFLAGAKEGRNYGLFSK